MDGWMVLVSQPFGATTHIGIAVELIRLNDGDDYDYYPTDALFLAPNGLLLSLLVNLATRIGYKRRGLLHFTRLQFYSKHIYIRVHFLGETNHVKPPDGRIGDV